MKPFSAVLLAGGESRRMGFDKSRLLVDGVALWERQLATLRAVEPDELFISGRRDGPYVGGEVEVVFDETPGLGPLGGIVTALRHAKHEMLLVLAVDMPAMTAEFLRGLVGEAVARGCGIVPRHERGFEPLAAIYPRSCGGLAGGLIGRGERSMQNFAGAAIENEFAIARLIADAEREWFANVNQPNVGQTSSLPNLGIQ